MAIAAVTAASPATNTSLRSVMDYVRLIRNIGDEVDDLASLFQAHRRALSSTTKIFFGDDSPEDQPKNSPQPPSAKRLELIVPNLKKLEKNYEVVAQLHVKLEELRMIEADLQVRFSTDEELAPSATRAIKELKVIETKLLTTLSNAYKFLQQVAQSTLPPACAIFVDQLSSAVSKSLDYKVATPYIYVFPYNGTLVFSHYLHLQRLTDDSGKEFPELFVVSSFELTGVNEKGAGLKPKTYLTTLNKFQAPGTFPLGKEVADIKTAVKVLSALLDLDNFENTFNRIPINQMIDPKFVIKEIFSIGNMVRELETDEDSLTFWFKDKVDSYSKATNLAKQLSVELQVLTRTGNVKVPMEIKQEPRKGFRVRFHFVRASDVPITFDDLRFLQNRWNVSQANIERILTILNKG